MSVVERAVSKLDVWYHVCRRSLSRVVKVVVRYGGACALFLRVFILKRSDLDVACDETEIELKRDYAEL